jgi:hypothetical protein
MSDFDVQHYVNLSEQKLFGESGLENRTNEYVRNVRKSTHL